MVSGVSQHYNSTMDRVSYQNRPVARLFPPIEPFDQRMLDVGNGHMVYVEQCGNPKGTPVLVLHGGPGGGCSPTMRRFFDPEIYRVVLFDQRGCGRSRPHASLEANTTWHLVADCELIRQTLGIDRWILFGGSWGATLALVYAQTHPDALKAMVLRGVFLMTRAELDWFYGGGAARFWPEQWQNFIGVIPKEEQDDLIAAYHKRLFSGNRDTEIAHAQAWVKWENALASVQSDGRAGSVPPDYARAFARIECDYFLNGGFMSPEQEILSNMSRIAHIPGVIVQGRYDMICPPYNAQRLADLWPSAELKMIPLAGHAMSEPGISNALVATMQDMVKSQD